MRPGKFKITVWQYLFCSVTIMIYCLLLSYNLCSKVVWTVILKYNLTELKQLEDLNTNRITRILTTDFPQYFAIVTRIRQEVCSYLLFQCQLLISVVWVFILISHRILEAGVVNSNLMNIIYPVNGNFYWSIIFLWCKSYCSLSHLWCFVLLFPGPCHRTWGRNGVINSCTTGPGCVPPGSPHQEDQSGTPGKPLQATQKPHWTYEKD